MQITIKDFDLKNTIESGQFFRFEKLGEWYYCYERYSVLRLKQENNKIFVDGDKNHALNLLGLTADYNKILAFLLQDTTLQPIIKKYKGLRIMNRDPWETLVSFQCSIMSNIPKIKKNMALLSAEFGQKIETPHQFHAFPNPGELNDEKRIRKCATGFRAKYIFGANKMVNDTFFAKLKKMKYEYAKEKLVELPGVADKVADCICLFSLGKTEAFPVDVWIERVMQEIYFDGEKVKPKVIRQFAHDRWGEHAGYAQQFLYHWVRNR